MKNVFAKSVLYFFLFLGFSTNAQVKKTHIEYDRLSDKVLVVWGGKIYKDQIIAIASEKGIVLIDAGKSPTLSKEYRKIIEREFNRNDFLYVINTHYHFDHSSGNQVFPEAEIISHETSAAGMRNFASTISNFVYARNGRITQWEEQLSNTDPDSEQYTRLTDLITTGSVMLNDYENNYILTLPTITFREKMKLDLGDINLHLYYWGIGMHTGDDIIIHCPEEQLLFSGDLFYKRSFRFAFIPSFDLERYISVLDEILPHNQIKWVYDCHNGRMSEEFISLYHKYMKDVFETLKTASKEGLTLDEVFKQYSFASKFSYIAKSGIDPDPLKRNHADNLKFTWYKVKNFRSAAEHLRKIITNEGISKALSEFEKISSSNEVDYFFDEDEFNNLGYQLMGNGKYEEAIEVFKINVSLYPESSNVYDSLGEAYMNSGNNELAIKNYEKSLKIDPTNGNAEQMIKKIKSEM